MPRDMQKWLGDGGMPLLGSLGAGFTEYGEGWAAGAWAPSPVCCNPQGIVQGGTYAVVLDAAMNFAVLASLERGETTATLEMKTSNIRAAREGEQLEFRGEVIRLAKSVAFTRAVVSNEAGDLMAEATGTFLLRRTQGAAAK